MKRWELVLGVFLVAGGLYDLFRRDWMSAGQYLGMGVGLLLGPERSGPGRVPAIILCVAGIGFFVARIVLR